MIIRILTAPLQRCDFKPQPRELAIHMTYPNRKQNTATAHTTKLVVLKGQSDLSQPWSAPAEPCHGTQASRGKNLRPAPPRHLPAVNSSSLKEAD